MRASLRHRVAVTRDEGPNGPLTLALRGQGLTTIACPAVVTLPPQDSDPLVRAAHDLENYQWMVATSVRAVNAITAARAGQPFPKWVRTAAVGPSTAAALRAAGAWAVLVGRGAGADDLIPQLRDADQWERCRVLVPRAAEGRRDLAAALRVLGARVDEVVAYRTRPRPSGEIAESFRVLQPDAVVVASPSAARALVAALGPRALRALAAVVAMGPSTASALAGLGVSCVVSEHTDFASLAERTRSALAFADGAIAAGEEI